MFASAGSRAGRRRIAVDGYQREAPAASGFTIRCRDRATLLLIDPAANFGSGTVYLPPSAAGDGDRCIIAASRGIQALSILAPEGATVVNSPGGIGPGGRLEFVYVGASGQWVCIDGMRGRPFRVPVATDFTWVNQGSVTTAAQAGALGVVAPAFGAITNNFALLVQAAPATTYSFAMTWNPGAIEWGGTNSGPAIALIIRNSSNGRFLSFANGATAAAGTRANGLTHWSSPTVINSSIVNFNTLDPVQGMRVDMTATTWTFYTGDAEGFSWRVSAMFTGNLATYLTAAGGTVDQVGFGFYTTNSWATYNITSFGTWT